MKARTVLLSLLFLPILVSADEAPDAVRDAIRSSEARFADAEMRRDVDAMMEMYSDDIVLLPPGEAPVIGKAAAAKWMNRLRNSKVRVTNERFETLELEVCGDLAFERGQVVADEEVPGRPARTGRTKYLSLWRRQSDGSWKVSRDIWDPIEEREITPAAAAVAAPVKVASEPPPDSGRIPMPDPQRLSEGLVRSIQEKLHSFARKLRAQPEPGAGSRVVNEAVTYLESEIRNNGWIDIKRFGVPTSCDAALIVERSGNLNLMESTLPHMELDLKNSPEGGADCYRRVLAAYQALPGR